MGIEVFRGYEISKSGLLVPTLETRVSTLEEASKFEWPVVVVGCGPGGMTVLMALRKYGVPAIGIDMEVFPRDKSCGDAVPARAVERLRWLLDDDEALSHFYHVLGVYFRSPRGYEMSVAFDEKDSAHGSLVVPRYDFDNFL